MLNPKPPLWLCSSLGHAQCRQDLCLAGCNHKALEDGLQGDPKGTGAESASHTFSTDMRLSKFLPELFSNLTFLCLHGTFLRCHLKANLGHQIPLSNQEDRCVIPRPACLLTHRGLCYANQDMSTPEFLLLSPVARTAASCESVLRAKTQPSSLGFSFLNKSGFFFLFLFRVLLSS